MPQIRPVKYTDSLGRPISGAAIYVYEVGKAYTDPGALLALTDAENGAAVANPFYTDSEGFPINGIGGARINPVTASERWGVYGQNANGVKVYDLPVQWSDTFGTGGAAEPPVDATFNNFADTILEDLAAFDFIFIRSQGGSGWENTSAGPDKSFYAHATGGAVGSPSSGTPALFYDSQGKEWAMSDISSIPYVTLGEDLAADVADLVTLSGVAANSTDLGTFTGSTIPNNSDNKEALQALESRLDAVTASDYVTAIGTSSGFGYRTWNSGAYECWGRNVSALNGTVVTLPVNVTTANYSLTGAYDDGNAGGRNALIFGAQTPTQFTLVSGAVAPATFSWYLKTIL